MRSGYEYVSIIENQGTLFVISELFVLVLLLTAILRFSPCYRINCVKKRTQSFYQAIFWGATIQLLIEMYLELAVGAQINLKKATIGDTSGGTKQSIHDYVSYYFALVMLIVVLLAPLLSAAFLLYNKEVIKAEARGAVAYIMSYKKNKSREQMR